MAIRRAGPKFEYKLRWFEQLTGYYQSFLDRRRAGSDLARNRKFESISLQRRVRRELDPRMAGESHTTRETAMPLGSANASKRAATLTPSPKMSSPEP
jgi:hypothetical protein